VFPVYFVQNSLILQMVLKIPRSSEFGA